MFSFDFLFRGNGNGIGWKISYVYVLRFFDLIFASRGLFVCIHVLYRSVRQ